MAGSVTVWLDRLKAGGDVDEAAAELWKVYFGRLVRRAAGHLRARPRAVADEEDVALSAFDSFVRAVAADRFPQMADRNDLWRVLLTLAARKAADRIAADGRLKRGGGRVVHVSAVTPDGADGPDRASAEPDPAEAVELAEGLDRLLAALDPPLRPIAVWALEGHTNHEIASKLDKSLATVGRKLARIRAIWGAGADGLSDD